MLKKKQVVKQGVMLLTSIFLLAVCAGCSAQTSSIQNDDIVTQKVTEKGKIPVTILVKYAFSANAFEAEVEARFPQIDIIQVGNYTDNASNELEQRMKHDDLPDLIFTWPYEIGREYFEDRLLDLSGMPFTSQYNISMLDKLSQDGKLYYLPGPAQIRGIVYNKTLFQENGWEVPTNYEEFLALCREIESAGIRPLQLSLKEPGVIEAAFWGFGYGGTLGRPKESQMLEDFNEENRSFGDFTQSAFESFGRLVGDGILKPEDLNVRFYQRTDRLFSRQCAMVSDGVELTHMGMDWSGCSDEFAVMPFFSPGEQGDWAQIYLTCHIGLNKNLAETQNKKKYEVVMQLMDYISSADGQKALIGDKGAMLSSVIGVPIPTIPEIADLIPTLEQGRYAPFPTLTNAQSSLYAGLSYMLEGSMSSEDVIEIVDAQNKNSTTSYSSAVIGMATESFSLIETGNFVTDAMRIRSGADIALFMDNGKDGLFNARGISARLYQGDITENDIKQRVLPVLQHNELGVLQVASMTGADIENALEHTLSDGDWFYYFAGLRMTFVPTAEPGSRIEALTDAEGNALDPTKTYTVAIMDGSVATNFIQSVQDLNVSIYDVVCDAIKDAKNITPSKDGRFLVGKPLEKKQ